MKVLKIKLYQDNANYRKPFSLQISETYPLPPYSTVNGWLHSVLNATEYVNLNLSIQGTYDTIYENLQTLRYYKKDYFKNNTCTKKPVLKHELYGVNLIIHIAASEDILECIANNIFNTFQSLGRHEDLVRIDEVKFTEVSEYECGLLGDMGSYKLKNDIYVPSRFKCIVEDNNLSGIYYKLATHYEGYTKSGKRNMKYEDTIYVHKGNDIIEGIILIDEDNDIVSFLNDLQ